MNKLTAAGSCAGSACESSPSPAALIAAQYALASAHTEIHSFTYGGFAKDIDILRNIATSPSARERLARLTSGSRFVALNHYLSHLFYRAKE